LIGAGLRVVMTLLIATAVTSSHKTANGLRFTGANRDAMKYRTRDARTQRFASGATAELPADSTSEHLFLRADRCGGRITPPFETHTFGYGDFMRDVRPRDDCAILKFDRPVAQAIDLELWMWRALPRQVTHHSAALSPENALHEYFVTEANFDVGSVIRECGHHGVGESG